MVLWLRITVLVLRSPNHGLGSHFAACIDPKQQNSPCPQKLIIYV